MKVSKIALACALAVAAMSAHAVPGIPVAPTNKLFIAGASGVDSFFKGVAATAVGYVAGTPTTAGSGVYFQTVDGNYYGYYGNSTNAATGVAVGQPLLILKRSAGGSAQGVGPVALSTAIGAPDWTNLGTPASLTNPNNNSYTIPNTALINLVPDMGVSDVEPKLFTGINQEFGVPALTSAQLASLTVKAWAQLAEGIVATKAVPDTYVLSNNFMRGALGGKYQDWSSANAADTSAMVICRRIEGSGTQAAFNSFFSSFPNTAAYNGYGNVLPSTTADSFGLDSAHAGTSADPFIIDASAGFTVFEGSGSGDVRKCLQAAQLGVDTGSLQGRDNKFYKLQFSAVGGPSKAIGVLSLDSYTQVSPAVRATPVDGKGLATSNADANGDWNFRTLNGNGTFNVATQTITSATSSGIAPSRANLLTNYYDFTVEPTVQKRSTGNSALVNTFFTYLDGKLGAPADMVVPNPNNTAPYAYVAVPSATNIKGTTSPSNLIADLTREGNTTAPLHKN